MGRRPKDETPAEELPMSVSEIKDFWIDPANRARLTAKCAEYGHTMDSLPASERINIIMLIK